MQHRTQAVGLRPNQMILPGRSIFFPLKSFVFIWNKLNKLVSAKCSKLVAAGAAGHLSMPPHRPGDKALWWATRTQFNGRSYGGGEQWFSRQEHPTGRSLWMCGPCGGIHRRSVGNVEWHAQRPALGPPSSSLQAAASARTSLALPRTAGENQQWGGAQILP